MKNLALKLSTITIIGLVVYIFILQECSRGDKIPEGKLLIEQSLWDSIETLADKPPEITIDTLYRIVKEKVYVDVPAPLPVPDPQDTEVNIYHDSLVNEEIAVWIDFRLRGELLNRQWEYTPITKEIFTHELIYVPKIVEKEVAVSKRGLYASVRIGGGIQGGELGAGVMLDYLNLKNNIYGIGYTRFNQKDFIEFKIGTKVLGRK